MNARRRACIAALLSLALVLDLPLPVARDGASHGAMLGASVSAAERPKRHPDPPRPPATPPVEPRAAVVPTRAEPHAVQPTHEGGGIRGNPGLNPLAQDSSHAPLDPRAQAAQLRRGASLDVLAPNGRLRPAPSVQPGRRTSSVVGGTGCNATPSSAPVLANADRGVGINHWWRYIEAPLPGIGRYMVNVATQNLLVQADDLDIPNAGIHLAFRRTYNSLSQHDSVGTDGATPGELGNGWTSTFDAHLSGNSAGGLTVSDIDGARYDYTADGQGHWLPPNGQHATLVTFDGGATYQWTKKTGTSYIFAGPTVNSGNSYEGYNGRLLKIAGRNHNTSIALTYYWLCGDAASNANLAEIDATTQAGVTAKLLFANFAGHQLLSKLVWPDGVTTITYSYDIDGGLISVLKPPANNVGKAAPEQYIYAPGNFAAESPRYAASNGSEGGYTAVFWTATRQVQGFKSAGVMNVSPADGTNAVLQPGAPTGVVQANLTILRNVSAGLNEFRDSLGHDSYYYFDASNRVTEVTEWTGSQWLATYQGWDAANNLTSTVDERGYETDDVYDANGNTVASAGPTVTLAQGTFRPTQLFSYDAFNNLVAACDATWSHANNRDWNTTGPPAPSDTLCPATAGTTSAPGPIVYWFSYPAQQPYGELLSAVSQLGYRRSYTYAAGSAENGLPLAVAGTAFAQNDGTTFQETKTFAYDANGNLIHYGTGTGTWSLAYDAANRPVSATDPDNVTTRTCYYPNGSVSAKQSALQYALDGTACGSHSVGFAYDVDGDVTSETHHFGDAAGTTQKWYDGADRLVEVVQPTDPTDVQTYAWMTRYLYDIYQSGKVGSPSTVNGTTVAGYGNLFKTMEYMPPTVTGQPTNPYAAPQWIDVRGSSFDALDRVTAAYEASFGTAPKQTSQYDGNGQLGLLSQTANGAGQVDKIVYDALGRKLTDSYSGDGGLTPNQTLVYDVTGELASEAGSDLGVERYGYDAEGRRTQKAEPSGGSVDSPATVTYAYYPNGMRRQLAIASAAFALPVSMAYAYRPDGKLQAESYTNQFGTYPFALTYSAAGRIAKRTDPLTGGYVPAFSGNNDNGTTYSMPATTFVPQTYQYDGNGNLSGMTIPRGGLYSSFTRDAENEVTGFNAYAIPGSAYTGGNEKIAYTTRGEVSQDSITCATFCSDTPTPNRYFNGFGLTAQADMRSGQNYGNPNESQPGTDFRYDGAGRLIGSTSRYTIGTVTPSLATVPFTRTYDASNHMRTQIVDVSSGNVYATSFTPCTSGSARTPAGSYPTKMTFSYWPDGHAASIFDTGESLGVGPLVMTWHWDGDTLLYTSSVSGATRSTGTYLGFDAMFSTYSGGSSTSVEVYDRDWTGTTVSSHSLVGGVYSYGAWVGQGPPAKLICKSGDTAHLYPISRDNDQVVASGVASHRSDGYVADVITLQGVRSYDPNAGQWTSPDAYAGDVHDPMTQKPFMWNRNNPYAYSDPSGYDWREAARSGRELLTRMVVSPFTGALVAIGVATSQRTGDGGSAENGGVTYKITSNSLQQVAQKHFQGGANSVNKSVFTPGTTKDDVTKMVESAVTTGTARMQGNGGTYKTFVVDTGKVIGTDRSGNPTSELQAVFDSNNEA